MAIGLPSRSAGYASRSSASVAGCRNAANPPCTARRTITQPTPGRERDPGRGSPETEDADEQQARVPVPIPEAPLAVVQDGVRAVPVLHDLEPAVHLPAQAGAGQVVTREDRAHWAAQLFEGLAGRVLGAAAGEAPQHLFCLGGAQAQGGGAGAPVPLHARPSRWLQPPRSAPTRGRPVRRIPSRLERQRSGTCPSGTTIGYVAATSNLTPPSSPSPSSPTPTGFPGTGRTEAKPGQPKGLSALSSVSR